MKNMHGWHAKFLIAICIFLSSCARHPRFESIEADSPRSAFLKLVEHRESLKSFKASPEFQVTGSLGKFKISGEIEYSVNKGWHIQLDGPFGIKLAVIESSEDGFKVGLPRSGSDMAIDINEPFEIPELGMTFPDLTFTTTLLLPLLPLNDAENWKVVDGSTGQPGFLILERNSENCHDSLIVSLDYAPIRIRSDELWRNGKNQYKRSLVYDTSNDYFPNTNTIKFGDLELYIKYGSVKIKYGVQTLACAR